MAPLDKKDTRRARRLTAAYADEETNPDDVPGLKTNPDGTFTLDENFYPLKAFVPEEICLGYLLKLFRDVLR